MADYQVDNETSLMDDENHGLHGPAQCPSCCLCARVSARGTSISPTSAGVGT
jgi:hypothetical protein